MYYIVETGKSFGQASTDLAAAVTALGFGVLHIHDLGSTLRSKGIDFKEDCKVFEVCNPAQAAKVLATGMRLNMALPCRISVFTEQGKTRIGLIKPILVFPCSVNTDIRQGSAMFSRIPVARTFAACAGLQTSKTLQSSLKSMPLLRSVDPRSWMCSTPKPRAVTAAARSVDA